MIKILLTFHGDLKFFLTGEKQQPLKYNLGERASIKDVIESLRVPHPEIEMIRVNRQEVDFSYLVNDGDIIEVYPFYFYPNSEHKIQLRLPLSSFPSFILDVHLGKLTSFLRMFGFDCLYRNDYDDQELAIISHEQSRILLTRDLGLLKRSIVTYGYYVRSTKPEEQLIEIMRRYQLFTVVKPLNRCLKCNGLLREVLKESIINEIPEKTRQYIHKYYRCQDCKQIYWKGSHYAQIHNFIQRVLTN
jgi:uncharacterized protein with PIN domain